MVPAKNKKRSLTIKTNESDRDYHVIIKKNILYNLIHVYMQFLDNYIL